MIEMTYLDQIVTDTQIILDKSTSVFIPARAIHLDPDIYEDPLKFKPERFSPSQVLKRHSQSFLGFGDGPRNCIGLRFGRMQNRIGLVTLLQNFKFSTCSKTSDSIKLNNHSFINVPLNNVYLKVEKL